jgi:predicted anti-sigma-YlaC factor YlaD
VSVSKLHDEDTVVAVSDAIADRVTAALAMVDDALVPSAVSVTMPVVT